MRWRYRTAVFVIMLSLLSACGGTHILPTPLPEFPTVAPLSRTAIYWDAGIQLSYPENWAAPIYFSGEMFLAPNAADASKNSTPTDPIITMQVSTLAGLNATKDTTLLSLLLQVSGANAKTETVTQATTEFGGLDATFIILHDKSADLYAETILFRLPDGRVAWLIVLTPGTIWGDFAPIADQIRADGKLVTSAAYTFNAPNSTAQPLQPFHYVPGGLTLNLPQGWIGQAVDTAGTVLYHAASDPTYGDHSGFSNGPQLVIRSEKLTAADVPSALIASLQITASQIRPFIVNGQSGAEYDTSDPATGQVVIFIAILGTDKTTLSTLRWTTPILLSVTMRPILSAALQTISFTTPGSASPLLPPITAP